MHGQGVAQCLQPVYGASTYRKQVGYRHVRPLLAGAETVNEKPQLIDPV